MKDYWAWSWDELVMHDLPSNVDFVYSKTGRKLHYVGHSLVINHAYFYIVSSGMYSITRYL
jgi:hypothetical protein